MDHTINEVEKRLLREKATERFKRNGSKIQMDERAEHEMKSKETVIPESDKDGCRATTTRNGFAHLENEIL